MRKNKFLKTGLVAMALIIAGSNNAFAVPNASANLDDNTANVNVQAKIEGSEGTVYKVDLEWGAMQFSYNNEAAWNPDTHEVNGDSGWTVTDTYYGANNTITVTNHSNAEVKVTYDYTKDPAVNSFDRVDGKLHETQAAARKAASSGVIEKEVSEQVLPTAVGTSADSAPNKSVYFSLSGTPDVTGATPLSKVGSIQITISANS